MITRKLVDGKARKERVVELALKSSSVLTRSDTFHRLVSSTFDAMDDDDTGDVGLEELYTGLLVIHLKLAMYAGPAACKPPTKKRLSSLLTIMDKDDSGKIDRNEFKVIMMILCSQIVTRIAAQWAITLVLAHPVSKIFVSVTSYLFDVHYELAFLPDTIRTFLFSLPVTVASSVFIIICIPFMLDVVDDYFLDLANIVHDMEEKKDDDDTKTK